MKKIIFASLAGIMMMVVIIAVLIFNKNEEGTTDKKNIRIGVSLYRFNDTFISSIKKEMENYVKYYEKGNGIKLNLEIVDADGSQFTQNKQVDRFISLNYDVICINPVERADASVIIDKALAADIPVVFFNRELNALVIIELKTGEFKTTYLGQLNAYLAIADDKIRKPHENPTIGIVLGRSANKNYAEYMVRQYDKPMGVATYKTSAEMPDKLRKALPSIDELKRLL